MGIDKKWLLLRDFSIFYIVGEHEINEPKEIHDLFDGGMQE